MKALPRGTARFAAWAAYAVVVTLGFALLASNRGCGAHRTVYETTRGVPANHRFAAGDVVTVPLARTRLSWSSATARDFEGRYAAHPYARGSGIDLGETTAEPSLREPPNTVMYAIGPELLEPADMNALDPGTAVEICGTEASEARCLELAVAAVRCDRTARCSAAVWIPRAKRARILASLDAAVHAKRAVRVFVRR